jgi:hypothetical protein
MGIIMTGFFAWFLTLIFFFTPVLAADIPFVFGDEQLNRLDPSQDHLEGQSDAGYPIRDIPEERELEFVTTGGGMGAGILHRISLLDLRRIFDLHVEPENEHVQEKALVLAAMYPGDHTIDQVCSIYQYLKEGNGQTKGWSYVGESRGQDIYRYANFTLKVGEMAGVSGVGDCDDFAILMSSLIEAIGGTTRIVIACNSSTKIGHAYVEVYLGKLDVPEDRVPEIIAWLKEKYNAENIYVHKITESQEIWLNLDWGSDDKGIFHPGGPLYLADETYVLQIRKDNTMMGLFPPEGWKRKENDDAIFLLDGVESIHSYGIGGVNGIPGSLEKIDSTPAVILPFVSAEDDKPKSLAISTIFGRGRVLALGHDGFFINDALNDVSNRRFGKNIINYLNANSPKKKILVSASHGEPWVGSGSYSSFYNSLDGYTIAIQSEPITAQALSDVSILFISSAGSEFTEEETNAIKNFVSNGGGLFIQGLGWAWVAYHPDETLEDYPMNRIGEQFGIRFLSDTLYYTFHIDQ